jgi:DNA-binding NtrC family response regulator
MKAITILAVDDDFPSVKLLARVLKLEGYDVLTASSGPQALERIREREIDAAVIDIRMPGMSGLELLREIKRHDPAIDVVMTTAHPDVGTAVEALKEGAADYLQKPFNLDELRVRMRSVLERRMLRAQVTSLSTRLGERLAVKALIASSPEMAQVNALIARVAPSDAPVLVEGESGTGKELVAAAVHRMSERATKPFIPVNCGALPAELMESELFGHVRGAFTGASGDTLGLFRSADGGTIFLDEVGEIPLPLQSKLLRVLQEREVRPVGSTRSHPVDARIVAATNRDLDAAVRQGTFRQDLFYRLNVVRIVLPPLRARRSDIPALVTHFVHQLNERFGRGVRGATPEALAKLMAYEFPGNVRELENLLERAYALGATAEITADDLPGLGAGTSSRSATTADEGDLPTIADAERDLIVRALKRYPRDRDGAARALGLSPRTFYRRLKEYGIP